MSTGPASDPLTLPLVLASQSAARASLLRQAGVRFEVVPAAVDEAAVKAALASESAPPRDVADTLAELKAMRGASRLPDRLVLGADQVLVCQGRIHDKPVDLADARSQLQILRGHTHELLSAAVLFEGGRAVWRHVSRAELTMRRFSDAFIDAYLEDQGKAVLTSVGGYRLEDGGAQLFSRVSGDVFTILGLPLLELLDYLRVRGVLLQ